MNNLRLFVFTLVSGMRVKKEQGYQQITNNFHTFLMSLIQKNKRDKYLRRHAVKAVINQFRSLIANPDI